MVFMSPDERVFRDHLERPDFKIGELKKRWRLVSVTWPSAIFYVSSRDGFEFGFRFECGNYPSSPVTARLWDIGNDTPLSELDWPQGGGRVAATFRSDWENGRALYLPCDFVAVQKHPPNWPLKHPSQVWKPAKGIVHYLEIVHDILYSHDYIPSAQPAA